MERVLLFLLQKLGVKPYRQTEIVLAVKKRLKSLILALRNCFLALGVGFLFAFVWSTNFGTATDQWLVKQFFSLRGNLAPPSEVVLIGIDDESFGELGESPRWPLPREHFATALENVVAANPRLVILDLTALTENHDPEANARIEAAMRRGKVTLGKGWVSSAQKAQVDDYVLLADPTMADAAALNLEMFLRSDRGTVWAIALFHEGVKVSPEKRYPLLSALRDIAGYDIVAPPPQNLINFYGPAGTINRIRFSKLVLPGAEDIARELTDKVVLIGFQSIARKRGHIYQEEFSVPVPGSLMFGAEIHATIAANLIENSSIARWPRSTEVLLLIFLLFGMTLLTLVAPVTLSWCFSFGLTALYITLSAVCFVWYSFFLPGAALLVMALAFVLLPTTLLRTLSDRGKIRSLLSRFGIYSEEDLDLK